MGKKIKSMGGRSFKKSAPKKSGNMNKLLQQAQQAQQSMEKEMEEMEAGLVNKEIEATSGGGVVKVIVTGDLRVKDIQISEELDDEDTQQQTKLLRMQKITRKKKVRKFLKNTWVDLKEWA
jgi:DNA-binding protein YbaB